MKDWQDFPDDDELDRADDLLGQADALLRRHRGDTAASPARTPPTIFCAASLKAPVLGAITATFTAACASKACSKTNKPTILVKVLNINPVNLIVECLSIANIVQKSTFF